MSSLTSLTELLQQSGVQFRIHDLGRQITKISPAQFALIETGQKVYPNPYLHHAWLALTLWNPEQKLQNVVWFLKFPLDEQGHLIQTVRDDFINRLMLNINQMLDAKELSEAEDALKDNPFSFTPDDEKMAMYHAIINRTVGGDKSQFYPLCQQYFAGERDWSNWQDLGLQGIAEIAVNVTDHQSSLVKNFSHYQQQPLIALCNALENGAIDNNLSLKIVEKLDAIINSDEPDIALSCSLLRALHASPNKQLIEETLIKVLNASIGQNPEVLTTIAVKLSTQLTTAAVLQLYLEKLAISDAGQQGFSRILADLMFSQELRNVILQAFRSPDRSEALIIAIGQMFGGKF
ncbi:MAG: DUF3549 family protein [Oceanospirillaceae bacterium]|nr:DUF3549 family protein [Oceanospirillaceae bacterium]